MEILTRGRLPWHQVYTLTCGVCGTIFRAEAAEVRHLFDGYDDSDVAIWRLQTNCPVCHEVVRRRVD